MNDPFLIVRILVVAMSIASVAGGLLAWYFIKKYPPSDAWSDPDGSEKDWKKREKEIKKWAKK